MRRFGCRCGKEGLHDDILDIMESAAVHPFADQRLEFRAVDLNRHSSGSLLNYAFIPDGNPARASKFWRSGALPRLSSKYQVLRAVAESARKSAFYPHDRVERDLCGASFVVVAFGFDGSVSRRAWSGLAAAPTTRMRSTRRTMTTQPGDGGPHRPARATPAQ